MWAQNGVKQKDVNDFVVATGDVVAFSDPAKLDAMSADRLVAKMAMIRSGLWQTKPKFAGK